MIYCKNRFSNILLYKHQRRRTVQKSGVASSNGQNSIGLTDLPKTGGEGGGVIAPLPPPHTPASLDMVAKVVVGVLWHWNVITQQLMMNLPRYELRRCVRCAVAHMRMRAKSILKSVRDVRACGSFLGVRCAIALLHTFCDKIARKCHFFS